MRIFEMIMRCKHLDIQIFLSLRQLLMFLIFCFCSSSLLGQVQTKEDVVNVLVGMGFENVGCAEDDKERVYVLQNSAFRANGVGIAKAVDVIQESGLPTYKPCRIVVLDNNIPQLSLCYKPIVGDSVPKATREDWIISYELGKSWNKVRKEIKTKNSSLFKVDVLVYPGLSLKNLIITQIYQVLFRLSPAVEVSLWKGMKLTAQLRIPVYNDGYGSLNDKVSPGFLTVSQSFRLPYNVFGRVTVGGFNFDRYGIDVDLRHPFEDERFSVMARIGYTGVGYWDGFKYRFDSSKVWTWTLGASFYWPEYNTQFNLKAEQYIRGDRGVKFEMIRHFRYCSIGFYAQKGKDAKSNGGFTFQVLLPPYKYKRKGYIPRISTSPNMGLLYNAGNEQNYYLDYKAEASDNIMNQNSFNPYYIKSEMLNY